MKCIRVTEDFSSTLREMCELACSAGSDVSDGDSGSSVDDWDHNTWNPLLDMLAEYRTGPVLLKLLRDEEAARDDETEGKCRNIPHNSSYYLSTFSCVSVCFQLASRRTCALALTEIMRVIDLWLKTH